jgi:hypothetical protein
LIVYLPDVILAKVGMLFTTRAARFVITQDQGWTGKLGATWERINFEVALDLRAVGSSLANAYLGFLRWIGWAPQDFGELEEYIAVA